MRHPHGYLHELDQPYLEDFLEEIEEECPCCTNGIISNPLFLAPGEEIGITCSECNGTAKVITIGLPMPEKESWDNSNIDWDDYLDSYEN